MDKANISIIVAMDKNCVIGKDGKMPWCMPADLKRFRQITTGHPVIMGRNTYDAIIKQSGHHLKERTNIVLSKKMKNITEPCLVAKSWDKAIKLALNKKGSNEIFVIGGAEIYKLALPHTTKMYITSIDAEIEGDTFFPNYNKSKWKLVSKGSPALSKAGLSSTFLVYKRINETNKKHLNLSHARTDEQFSLMEKISEDRVCPFCPEHLKKYHPKPIIKEGKWWIVTENMTPYEGTALSILLICKKHVTTISEITPETGKELLELSSWISGHYKISSGALFMRFGDTDKTGATVAHLHAQLIAGNSSRNKGNPLRVKLGYKK